MAARAPRLLPHVVVAGALLLAVAWWTGADGQVSVDEGVAVIQGRLVADGEWATHHPLELADRDGSAFPLRHATRTDAGYVPFAKHPLYPAVLSVADDVGGVRAMVGLSLAGVLGAAVASAALARRLDSRLPVPTLYAVALGSPLLFDSTLVIAHGMGAATAGAAAWAVLRHHETGRPWSPWSVVAVVAGATTILLRGEGLLLVLAATGLAGLAAVVLRSRAAAWLTGTGAVTLGLGLGVDAVWRHAILLDGGRDVATLPGSDGSWLSARLDGLATVVGQVGYGDDGHGRLLVLGVVLLGVLAVVVRRDGGSRLLADGTAAVAVLLVVLWAVDVPPSPVPGLLLACPLLWFGLVAGRWADQALARALVAVAGAFGLGVVLTQYDEAGGFEWGARYLALALPLVVPVALLGLRRALDDAPRATARAALGAVAAVTLVLGVAGAVVRRDLDRGADRLGDLIVEVAPPSTWSGSGGRPGPPIVVSTELAVPQALWPVLDDASWLRIDEAAALGEDPDVARLRDLQVDRFTVVTRDLAAARARLGEVELERVEQLGEWTVAVVRTEAAP